MDMPYLALQLLWGVSVPSVFRSFSDCLLINADLKTWCKVQVFKTLMFTCILPNTYLGFFQATQGFEQVPQVTTNTVQVLKNQNHTISFTTSDSPEVFIENLQGTTQSSKA